MRLLHRDVDTGSLQHQSMSYIRNWPWPQIKPDLAFRPFLQDGDAGVTTQPDLSDLDPNVVAAAGCWLLAVIFTHKFLASTIHCRECASILLALLYFHLETVFDLIKLQ